MTRLFLINLQLIKAHIYSSASRRFFICLSKTCRRRELKNYRPSTLQIALRAGRRVLLFSRYSVDEISDEGKNPPADPRNDVDMSLNLI